MTLWCSQCEKWTAIPADLAAGETHARCEYCGSPLPTDSRYGLCPECGRYHRTGYEVCPFRIEGMELSSQPALRESPGEYSIEAQKRRTRKRNDEYYWQLYIDYRDKPAEPVVQSEPVEPAVPAESPDMDEEPPHPADVQAFSTSGRAAGNGNGNGNGNSHAGNYRNGNGHGALVSHNGTGGNGTGTKGGYGRGNNGHATGKVDLALTERTSLMLFPEIEQEEASAGEEATPTPGKIQAGNYNEFDYELINDPSRLAQLAEILAQEKIIGIDTETTGLDPHTCDLLLLQISTLDKVYIIDCKRVVPVALKPVLENPHILKVAQNAKFEYEMLKQQVGIAIAGMFDTMLAERLVTAGIGREISLKAIAQKYIDATLDKSVRETFHKLGSNGDAYLAPEQLHYAARDAFIMIPIYRLQQIELKKHKLLQVAELEFRCIAAVGDMELAGVQIDSERWRKIISDVAVQRDKSQGELSELLAPASMQATMFGVPSINLNSNQQLIEALSKLGVELPDTMEATLLKYNHPAVTKLLEYRGHEKTLSAFGENVLSLINPKTGRIHPDFNQYGADTGRFSCTKPNIQQIPATSDFRKCFIAAEGYKLVTCVAAGTRIATTRGLLPVELVEVGDQVLQEDGSTRSVQRVLNQGERPTVKIKTVLGYEIEATPEHRVRIIDAAGCYVWREVGQLSAGDCVAIKLDTPFCKGASPFTLKYAEVEHFNAVNRNLPERITPELARLFGYITWDGTLRDDYAGWVVNDQDEDLAAYLSQLAEKLFAIQGQTYRYRGVIEHRLHSKQLLKWLRNAGVAKNKVPEFLWSSDVNIAAAYLQGLFEADGSVQSVDTGRISFSTIHEQLAFEVQQLLAALGIASARRKIEHGKGVGYIWFVIIPSNWKERFRQQVGFLSQRKRSSLDALVQRYKVNQHTGGMPNLQRKARALVGVESSEVNVLLANTRFRGSVVSEDLARQIREISPIAYASLELFRTLEHSVIFDQVRSVVPGESQVVYDLTVEDTSTYVSQGFVSHNCDYSQAELRILAELSQDVAFVEAFKSGQDLHTLTASQMFGVPVDQVQKPQRSAAKAINFGLAYGMGPGGLAPRLGVTLDEAKELINRYFKAYPGIQRWLDKAGKDAVRLGYSATPLGRKRFYNMPDESLKRYNEDEWRRQIAAIERQGKNTPIQGCLHGNTRILVRGTGYVPISEVSGRDVEVWDGDRFVRAHVAPSGKKQLVRMTLRGGYHIECSLDHKFWVASNNGYRWIWKWKTPGEIRAQNRVSLNQHPVEWSYPLQIEAAVPGVAHNASHACLTTMHDSTRLGEWLGRVASDGNLGKNNSVSLVVAEHEEAILEPLLSITEHWGHVHHHVRTTVTQPQRLHTLTLGAKGLHDQLVASRIKERIPPFAWRDSSLMAAYLRGLFDGDGSVHPDGAVLTFGQGDKHLKWAREVQQALLLLGIRSRLSVYTNHHYRINLRVLKRDMPLFCERVGFINPAKQDKARRVCPSGRWERVSPQYGMANLVESIEFTDEWVDMYDVVNSETGRFMANGMIVHNSNADMTKLALINLRSALQSWDARTVNTVHDEIVVEARVDQAEEVKHLVEDAMIGAGQAILKEVPIVADASLADYWSK